MLVPKDRDPRTRHHIPTQPQTPENPDLEDGGQMEGVRGVVVLREEVQGEDDGHHDGREEERGEEHGLLPLRRGLRARGGKKLLVVAPCLGMCFLGGNYVCGWGGGGRGGGVGVELNPLLRTNERNGRRQVCRERMSMVCTINKQDSCLFVCVPEA
jgi:hypothetical protein